MNRHERRKQASWARRDPRLRGMDVRYGGRTLSFDVMVNTDEEAEAVCWRIKAQAPGPKQVMTVVAARALAAPEVTDPIWKLDGIETFFGGRTLTFQVCLNTDEDAATVSDRILAAARAPGNPATEAFLRELHSVPAAEPVSLAVFIAGGDVEPDTARKMWEAAFSASVQTVENEN